MFDHEKRPCAGAISGLLCAECRDNVLTHAGESMRGNVPNRFN